MLQTAWCCLESLHGLDEADMQFDKMVRMISTMQP